MLFIVRNGHWTRCDVAAAVVDVVDIVDRLHG